MLNKFKSMNSFFRSIVYFVLFTIFYFILGHYIDVVGINYYKEFFAKPLNGRICILTDGGRGKSSFRLNTQIDGDGLYLERDPIIEGEHFNMYQIAEVGDSIAKDTNTAYLKLIKKNGEEIWFKMVEH